MLRVLVLVLALLNGVYFAWSQDWLRDLGFAAVHQAEPQRLAQQVRPEAVRVVPAEQAREIETRLRTRGRLSECRQAGPFNETEAVSVRRVLEAALPPAFWRLDVVEEPARWLIYMGKYAQADMVAKKRAELAMLNIKPQPPNNPDLEPGLSLGAFDTQAQAEAELQALGRRGVRTARVVQERAAVQGYWVRVPAADDALLAKLGTLEQAMSGKAWQPCP